MIKIVLTASPNPFSWAIRKITKARVSHTMGQFDGILPFKRPWVFEAMSKGTRLVPARRVRHNIVVEYECLVDLKPALLKVIEKRTGDGYDTPQLFSIAFYILCWKLFKRRIKVGARSMHSQICSEIWAEVFIEAKLIETSTWDIEYTSPKRIDRYCGRHPELFREIPREGSDV